jgi:hypothetical protein
MKNKQDSSNVNLYQAIQTDIIYLKRNFKNISCKNIVIFKSDQISVLFLHIYTPT